MNLSFSRVNLVGIQGAVVVGIGVRRFLKDFRGECISMLLRSFLTDKNRKCGNKNRIGMAPLQVMGPVNPGDDCYSPRVVEYYVERAKGGAGLIITGATEIENNIERSVPGIYPTISTNHRRFNAPLLELTERVHAYGCKIFIQLAFGLGRSAPPEWVVGQPIAPSPVPNHWDPQR